MADQPARKRRRASWRGRLTVLGLFALGLLALAVLQIAYLRVGPPATGPDAPTNAADGAGGGAPR